MQARLRAAVLLVCGLIAGCQSVGLRAPWAPDEKVVVSDYSQLSIAAERIDKTKLLAKQAAAGGEAGDAAKRDMLAQIQEERDPLVRMEILKATARLDDAVVEPVLAAGLRDESEAVRETACRLWGKRGGAAAVTHLAEVVRTDESMDVQLAALRALGKTGEPAAAEAIAPALGHRNPAMQYRAVVALQKVSDEDLGNDVAAWRRRFDPNAELDDSSLENVARGGFRFPNPFRR